MPAGNYYLMGDDVVFVVNTGTNALPVWAPVDNAEEPMLDLGKSEATFKPRGIKFELTRGAKHQWEFTWKYSLVKGVADSIRDIFYDSFVNGTPIQLGIADADLATADVGFTAWCEVLKFPFSGKEEEGSQIDCAAKPTDYQETGPLVPPAYIITG